MENMKRRSLNRHEGGQMRTTVTCPVCGERCKLDGSRRITNRLREQKAQCLNMLCGWTGVIGVEAIRTINMPSDAYDASLAPPKLSRQEIEHLQAEDEEQPPLL